MKITTPLFCAANQTWYSGERLYPGQALCFHASPNNEPISWEGLSIPKRFGESMMVVQRQFGLLDTGHPIYLEWWSEKQHLQSSQSLSSSSKARILWQPFGDFAGVHGAYLTIEHDMVLLYEQEWGAVHWAVGHCGTPSQKYGVVLTSGGLVMLGTRASIEGNSSVDDELALWTIHPGGMEERICPPLNLPPFRNDATCVPGLPNDCQNLGLLVLASMMVGAVMMRAFLLRQYRHGTTRQVHYDRLPFRGDDPYAIELEPVAQGEERPHRRDHNTS